MLIHNINSANITSLDVQIKSFWTLNKNAILLNDKVQWNDEDLTGKSFAQWKSMSYYYLLSLLTLIQIDISHTSKLWSYYYEKYNLANLKKCLSCIGIDLNKNLQVFGFPTNSIDEVVEPMSIEDTFEVEIESIDPIEENIEMIDVQIISSNK